MGHAKHDHNRTAPLGCPDDVPGAKPHGHKITLGRAEVEELRRKLGVSDKLPPRAQAWGAVWKYLGEER